MCKYDFFALSLLALYEDYLPCMTDEDIIDILQYGAVPGPWKVKKWESMKVTRSARIEDAIETAISRQK